MTYLGRAGTERFLWGGHPGLIAMLVIRIPGEAIFAKVLQPAGRTRTREVFSAAHSVTDRPHSTPLLWIALFPFRFYDLGILQWLVWFGTRPIQRLMIINSDHNMGDAGVPELFERHVDVIR